MIFKTLTLEERMKLIKGKDDVLTKEYNREQEYIKRLTCLRCGNPVASIVDTERTWSQGKILPNILVKCIECEAEYEPYTGIEVSGPKNMDDLDP